MNETAEASIGAALVALVILSGFVASFVLWTRAFFRYGLAICQRLVPLRPRRQPFWSPVHFLLAFGCFVVFISLLLGIAQSQRQFQSLVVSLSLNMIGGLAAVVGTIHLLSLKVTNASQQLGLVLRWRDVRLGLVASVMILPPVMILSGVVSSLVEYHHPVLDSLQAQPSAGVFIAMLFGTAIITPFVEEFLFRVLLQGGLQGIADHVNRAHQDDVPAPTDQRPDANSAPSTAEARAHGTAELNPYAVDASIVSATQSTEQFDESASSSATSDPEQAFRPKSWWPIIIASIVFAGMHVGQGAAPIPLFFLSIGLGYLYRQTGTITASLVVHAVLNFITVVVNYSSLAGT